MRKFLLLALLIAPLALAQVDRTVTIQHATERADGTPLSLAEIERVDIRCYINGTQTEVTSLVIVPPNTVRATDPVFTPGDYICRAWTVDTLGQTSLTASESNVFTVAHPCAEEPNTENCAAPNPPISIAIELIP